MSLTPAQHTVSAELVSRGTGINCHEEAVLLLGILTTLIANGERPYEVIRWMSLLPRARGKQAVRMQAPEPSVSVEDLHPQVQSALQPARSKHARRSVARLIDPDAAAEYDEQRRRIDRHGGRPAKAACKVCGKEFRMNETGRPAVTCPEHRYRR